MDILINGKNIEYSLESEKTIGEVLGSVESACEEAGMTVTSIAIDGSPVSPGALDALFAQAPSSVAKIELETLSGENIKRMLADLGARFSECVPALEDISVQLQIGKDLEVMETIHSFSLDLERLYKLIPLVHLTGLLPADVTIDGVGLEAFPSVLAPLLSELLSALERKDTVLVGDISEYELAPKIGALGAMLNSL